MDHPLIDLGQCHRFSSGALSMAWLMVLHMTDFPGIPAGASFRRTRYSPQDPGLGPLPSLSLAGNRVGCAPVRAPLRVYLLQTRLHLGRLDGLGSELWSGKGPGAGAGTALGFEVGIEVYDRGSLSG